MVSRDCLHLLNSGLSYSTVPAMSVVLGYFSPALQPFLRDCHSRMKAVRTVQELDAVRAVPMARRWLGFEQLARRVWLSCRNRARRLPWIESQDHRPRPRRSGPP